MEIERSGAGDTSIDALLDRFNARTPSAASRIPSTPTARKEGPAFSDRSDPFLIKPGASFQVQYAQLYFTRLMILRPLLAKKMQDQKFTVGRILELKRGHRTCIIGTLYKDMKLKPGIFQRINAGNVLGSEKGKNFVSDDDSVYLEDETGC